MLKINKNFKFVVVTDDVNAARRMFPHYEVNHWNIAKDYSVIKNAKYLILSNSSFSWFPTWLSDTVKFIISPKYNARHNVSNGYWSIGQNITKGWNYQDRDGNLFNYDDCVIEFDDWKKNNNY
jgi:hypothetical protein